MNLSDIIDTIDDADPTGCAVWAISFLFLALSVLALVVAIKLVTWSVSWGLS